MRFSVEIRSSLTVVAAFSEKYDVKINSLSAKLRYQLKLKLNDVELTSFVVNDIHWRNERTIYECDAIVLRTVWNVFTIS